MSSKLIHDASCDTVTDERGGYKRGHAFCCRSLSLSALLISVVVLESTISFMCWIILDPFLSAPRVKI